MTDIDPTDFDVVYKSNTTNSNTGEEDVYHVYKQCQYYQSAKTMHPWDPRSLWDSTVLCSECERLLECDDA